MRFQNRGRFERAHEAGVESHEVEGGPAILERGADLADGHAVLGKELIVAVAGDRAASVVPEDQFVTVGGVA
jgi:hypothetical protein